MIANNRILHVDNEISALYRARAILRKNGWDVTSTTSGKRALKLAKLQDFSLIILDVIISDICGWKLFKEISTLKPTQKIIYLSSLEVSSDLIKKLKKDGISDYISKPFDRIDFINRVNTVARNQESSI